MSVRLLWTQINNELEMSKSLNEILLQNIIIVNAWLVDWYFIARQPFVVI